MYTVNKIQMGCQAAIVSKPAPTSCAYRHFNATFFNP